MEEAHRRRYVRVAIPLAPVRLDMDMEVVEAHATLLGTREELRAPMEQSRIWTMMDGRLSRNAVELCGH